MKQNRAWLNRAFSLAGLAIGAGILVYLVLYVREHVALDTLLQVAEPAWLLGAALCIPVCETVDALIFYWMGRRSGCPVRLRGCLDTTFIGEFYYKLGPAGAPVQLKLMCDAGMSAATAASVYTWKMAANTVVYTGYAVAALALKVLVRREPLGWAVGGAGALICCYVLICGAVLLLASRPAPVLRLCNRALCALSRRIPALARKNRAERAGDWLGAFCTRLSALRGDRPMLLGLFAGMFLELGLLFSIPHFLYHGLGCSGASAADLILTQCLVMVLSRIILLPGNAGGAEGSFYLFMEPIFGQTLPVALVLWRCAAFLEVLLLGGLWSVVRFARPGRRHPPAARS